MFGTRKMITAVSVSSINSLIKNNLKIPASTSDGAKDSMSNGRSKDAMRFLAQRTKRFGDDFNPIPKPEADSGLNKPKAMGNRVSCKVRLIERLQYLGMTPRKLGTKKRSLFSKKKRYFPKTLPEALSEDDEFVRPKVLECDYCTKIFFNKMVHRSHTIEHLRTRRCTNCNEAFRDTMSHRRHQAQCRQRLHYVKRMCAF